MQSLVENVCFSAPFLLLWSLLGFIIVHLLLALYPSEKMQVLTCILTLGLAWLEIHMGSGCWDSQSTLLVAALWLGKTPGCLSLGRKHSFCYGKSYQVTLPGQKEKAGPIGGIRFMEPWGFSLESFQQLGFSPNLTYPEHIFISQSKAIFLKTIRWILRSNFSLAVW